MIVHACVDESYSTASGGYIMAGALATEEMWARFEQEWHELLVFIPSPGRNRKRAFKWREMKRSPHLPAFYNTIRQNVMCTFAFAFSINAFRRARSRYSPRLFHIDWGKLDHDYIFAFWMLVSAIFLQKNKIDNRIGSFERIEFIFDDISEKRAISREWDRFVETMGQEFSRYLGKTPRFGKEEDFLPLQAADFQAGYVRYLLEGGKPLIIPGNSECPHLRIWINEQQICILLDYMLRDGLRRFLEGTPFAGLAGLLR